MSAPVPIRRRDAVATKAKILEAAKECFSKLGYANTGIRDVAAVAGVSFTLLGRYYGSKAGLLEAALEATLVSAPFLHGDRDKFGERLASLIATTVETEVPTSMTVLAAGDPDAREIATRLVRQRIIEPMAEWLGGSAAHDRAVAITMMGAGFITHLRLLPMLAPDRRLTLDDPLLRWLATSLQKIVDEPDAWRDPPAPIPLG